MAYKDVTPPAGGKITIQNGKLTVPANPILPFIRGDGTGPDIWAASVRVFDAAVQKAYGGKRKISWFEVFAGEAAKNKFDNWLPDDTVEAFKEYLVGIKGPLTTPVGGGIRSLNVALRQMLDLYVCLRPVQWFHRRPVARETSGEGQHGHLPRKHRGHLRWHRIRRPARPKRRRFWIFCTRTSQKLRQNSFWHEIQGRRILESRRRQGFPNQLVEISEECGVQVGIGIKPVSYSGSTRLIRSAISYAIQNRRKSVTLVHKGNIMKFTEGAFRDWGYKVAKELFGAVEIDGGPWCKIPEGKPGAGLVIKDAIADITLQQVLTRPTDFDVIATLNLNGDYLSDALAAQVGGIGIAPGGNINYISGHAIFEATHGTAPKYANKDVVNPGSVVLSGEMMFRYLGWTEAADLVLKGLNGAIGSKRVTYDFARQMDGATEIKCSQFGDNIISHM